MTHEQLIEGQLILGKNALELVFDILRNPNVRASEQKFGFFEGEDNNSWKMTIERVSDEG